MAVAPLHESNRAKVTAAQLRQLPRVVTPAVKCGADVRVDLRTSGQLTTGRLKDIAVAAVTLDEAKRTFGRGTRRYFVYAGSASAEKQARGYLRAAEYHADEVFNFLSRTDRAAYLDYIFAALRGDLAGVARLGAPVGKNVRPRASARR